MSCAGRTRRAPSKRGARTLEADDDAIGIHSLDEVGCPGPGGLKLGGWPDGVHVFLLLGVEDDLSVPGPFDPIEIERSCIGPPPRTAPCVALDRYWSEWYFAPAGADAYKGHQFQGAPTAVCGTTTYEGYAIPLLEPHWNLYYLDLNSTCFDSPFASGSAWYSGALNYHADGTSPSSVWIEATQTWRMYINDLVLINSETGESENAETGEEGFPRLNPAIDEPTANDTDQTIARKARLPLANDWRDSGRFEPNYIAFVDSCDDGASYPIFGPETTPRPASGCPPSWEQDWTNAGWSVTSIPSRTAEDPDEDGIYCVYREPIVFDFSEELCLYLMVCLECRSTSPSAGVDAGSGDCVNEDPDICFNRANNRIVLFVSDTPDFSAGRVFPRPGYVNEALVLLQPDEGLVNPPDCQSEDYGVPHALLTPDRTKLLLYAPWGVADITTGAHQARLSRTYTSAAGYPIEGRPLWWDGGYNGTSGFAIDVATLSLLLRDFTETMSILDEVERLFTIDIGRRDALTAHVDGSYQGEVLIWDGAHETNPETFFGLEAPTNAVVTDPQWMFDSLGELFVYFDLPPDGLARHSQLRRATLVEGFWWWSASEVWELAYGPDFTEAFSANGAYTLFIVDGTVDGGAFTDGTRGTPACDFLLDMRELFNLDSTGVPTAYDAAWDGEAQGRLVGDPDALELPDGRVRILYSGGETSTLAEGLHVAIKS